MRLAGAGAAELASAILSAKKSVRLTRKRTCFSLTGSTLLKRRPHVSVADLSCRRSAPKCRGPEPANSTGYPLFHSARSLWLRTAWMLLPSLSQKVADFFDISLGVRCRSMTRAHTAAARSAERYLASRFLIHLSAGRRAAGSAVLRVHSDRCISAL